MASISIVGSGISGMAAALYLTKAGHAVTVFERDDASLPPSAEQSFEWERRGAPQIRHSHAMLAKLRCLLQQDHPDVLERLLAQGATEMKLYEDMPLVNGESVLEEADYEIVLLACRRSTLEYVMRSVLSENALVTFRAGEEVTNLMRDESNGAVCGLELSSGNQHSADIVIAADGRRSSVPRWLDNLSIERPEDIEEPAGIVYFSRFYRLNPGADFPSTRLIANDLGFLFYAAFCGDNGYFSFALSANDDDQELKEALKDPKRYEAIAAQIPELEPWLACGSAVSEIAPMAGLINRRREFVTNGKPVLTGLHVIGDALICTNPAYGRGLTMAVWQAKLLSEAITDNISDAQQQSIRFSESLEVDLAPWFDIALMMDGARRAERERLRDSGDNVAAPDNPMKALADAANADPEIWRTFWRAMNLLAPPSDIMAETFIEKVVLVSSQLPQGDTVEQPINFPTRHDLLNV